MIACPECNSALDFDEDDLDIGDEFTCEECGANLRVADTEPLDIESADDDDDRDEDEDDDAFDEDEDEDEEESGEEEDEW